MRNVVIGALIVASLSVVYFFGSWQESDVAGGQTNVIPSVSPTTSFSPQARNDVVNVDAPSLKSDDAELAKLKKQMMAMHSEMTALKQQQATGGKNTVDNDGLPDSAGDVVLDETQAALQHEQLVQSEKYELDNRMQVLNQNLDLATTDDTRAESLKVKIDSAFETSNISQDVSIRSASCNADMCKLEVVGQPTGDKSVTQALMENNVFTDSEVLAVPDNNGGWTIYASAEGKKLPVTR